VQLIRVCALLAGLQVDDGSPQTAHIAATSARYLDLDSHTFFGGVPPDLQTAGRTQLKGGLVGCLRGIMLDGVPLPLSLANSSSGVGTGCRRRSNDEKCVDDGSSCGAAGSCHETWFDLECRCTQGNTGSNCGKGESPGGCVGLTQIVWRPPTPSPLEASQRRFRLASILPV